MNSILKSILISFITISIFSCTNEKDVKLKSNLSIGLGNGEFAEFNVPEIIEHKSFFEYSDYTGGKDYSYNTYITLYNNDTLNITIRTQPRGNECEGNPTNTHLNSLADMYKVKIMAENKNANNFSSEIINKNDLTLLVLHYNDGCIIYSCIHNASFYMTIENTTNKKLIELIIESFKIKKW